MLVASIGYQDTATRTGIPANTLYQWARRFSWNTPIPHVQKTVRTVRNPADVLSDELEANGHATKLSLSRSAKRLAAESETATLGQSKHVLNVAKTAATISPELYASGDKNQAQVAVNIAILSS